MKGKLARVVVHATGVHECESVPDGIHCEHWVACQWVQSAISQRGSHHST